MKKSQPTEYMYASSRIHALERYMVGRERVEALLDSRSVEDAVAKLGEYGLVLPETSESLGAACEEMLLSALRRAYDEVEAAVPDPAPFRAYRYPYDCNNLKVAIKCAVRGISADGLLFDFGTVPADQVEGALREGKEAALYPPAMAAAVTEAREAYGATSDPRRIDAVLDRACYADMLSTLSELGDETVLGWLRAKIDLTNILICLRILRMKRGASGEAFLTDTLLLGGTLSEKFFLDAYAAGEAGLWSALIPTPYTALCRIEGDEPSSATVERVADDLLMGFVREGARTPFGAAVVAGYLLGWETAVKNIRILLAAKDAGLAQELLRERIRASYV